MKLISFTKHSRKLRGAGVQHFLLDATSLRFNIGRATKSSIVNIGGLHPAHWIAEEKVTDTSVAYTSYYISRVCPARAMRILLLK